MPFDHLAADHPIRQMVEEHREILHQLKALAELPKLLQQAQAHRPDLLARLRVLAANLSATENHHKREEEALFPILVEQGIEGMPAMMSAEHGELRALKAELHSLVEQAESISFEVFPAKVRSIAQQLVPMLEEHIQKEDGLLYPEALESLDEEQWAEVQTAAQPWPRCSFMPLPRLQT
jgi:hemerythrin-like domain-containing protein